MEKVIQLEDRYYILATAALDDDRKRVLKQGETFGIFDCRGDIQTLGMGEQGVYHEGTRFLSRLMLKVNAERPLLLSSAVKEDNILLAVDLMNPDLKLNGQVSVARGMIHLFRGTFLWEGVCYQNMRFYNYGQQPVDLTVTVDVEADFADLFEVRGSERERRGKVLAPQSTDDGLVLGYEGLDDVERRTRIAFSPAPDALSDSTARFELRVEPREAVSLVVSVSCETGEHKPPVYKCNDAHKQALRSIHELRENSCTLYTANEQFNEWANRSLDDLLVMLTRTEHGWYPYAGVPWYNTAFGRDGLITALQSLWVNPDIARGVLKFLAATQAEEHNAKQDAEPGKILHETRKGEMAELGEIPFKRYYGTIDATPLFIVLAGAYYDHTDDKGLIEELWPNIRRALEWIDEYGDSDGDGFIEYERKAADGLDNQGWKDSHDAVFYEDGSMARGGIALCEVQGYVYQAKRAAAHMVRKLGDGELAQRLASEASELKQRFQDAFWLDDLGTYALALDGEKRPCRVRTSNAGHCLFSEIASEEHAQQMVETLFDQSSFCGWGIRTLATQQEQYNPMSYHNGSVWPHDNAMIALGLARYGFKNEALKLLAGLFDASMFVTEHRMPELFCGFRRRAGKGPVLYPVACLPQAWAAGSIFMILQACLGLRVEGAKRRVCFESPRLPPFLDRVKLKNLPVGGGRVDLLLERYGVDVGVNVTDRSEPIGVVITK